MLQYTIRRLLLAIPVLIGILVVTFILARMIPGDPCKAMLGERATAQVCERFYAANGLDQPVTTQFAIYMGNILQGDFGNSIRFSRPVTTIMVERLPLTIELGTTALIIAILIGIPAGILSAVKRNSIWDVITMVGANIGVSMPVYWLGLMLAYLFALVLRGTPLALPPSGRLSAGLFAEPFYQVWGWEVAAGTFLAGSSNFISNMYIFNSILTQNWEVLKDAIRHLILPALALSTIPLSIIARMTRSSMLEVMKQDYIRTARAKGLKTMW
jgi:peptide/nickel transport system permease protein